MTTIELSKDSFDPSKPREIDPVTSERIEALLGRIKILEAWVEGDCFCPCCEETIECLDDCTFSDDDPTAAERMRNARELMYGESA